MKVHNIAVVGCGAFAREFHLPHIRANPRLALAVVCDLDRDAAEACARQFGAGRSTDDWKRVVDDPGIDLILLATHTQLRSALILPAIQAGKPVYVEKPLAATQAEMLAIVRASRRAGVPVCVGHNRRSSPAVLELRRLVAKVRDGRTGWLPSVDRSGQGGRAPIPEQRQMQMLIRVNDDCRSWKDWVFADPEGILFAEMVHFIDVALWLNATPPVRVFAEGSARGNFSLAIRFEDGSTTTVHHTLAGHFDAPKELIEVALNHVSITLDHNVEIRQWGLDDEPFRRTYPFTVHGGGPAGSGIEGYYEAVAKGIERARKDGTPPPFLTPDKGHARHLDRFLDCIESGAENPCDVADALVVTRVALKLLDSVRLGIPLPVGPEDWHVPAV